MDDADYREHNARVIAEFRANRGKVGGVHAGATLLLLHTQGARTGLTRTSPLVYLADRDRYVVFASKGGSPAHPGWYHNLRANPHVRVEVGSSAFEALATVAGQEERDRLWDIQQRKLPNFAEYQRRTARTIPVVILTPTDAPVG
jgi:deazaflavin-dependent oxidoreductase (nitroreductase family)